MNYDLPEHEEKKPAIPGLSLTLMIKRPHMATSKVYKATTGRQDDPEAIR